ncbi:MAG: NADH-quinone oxidoreductase subunit B [Caldilineaceae bacterium SB0668_bin_21]|nr:NADH-quinone oxidoreductase subunit B [Caldilineaceae bacterium SB0668_bin_21]MYC20209.1 NADH-quinone oxidoreductase subunit B [Caldilineaceae bacterium SB0662_bin_25]
MASLPPDFQQLKQDQLRPFLHDEISVPEELEANVLITTVDKIYNWSRRSSMWPLLFGLACCAIEMIATAASRYDLSRFGMEVMRPSPRQSDLMIVSGTVTKKMVPAIVRIYNQMAEPRYVVSMGACATGGGPFKEGYNVVSGIDKYIPVDVYVPGCPPTPEALIYGLMKMHEKVDRQSVVSVPWYQKDSSQFVPVPRLGPDVFDPRQVELIKDTTLKAASNGAAAASNGAGGEGAAEARGPVQLSEKAIARMEEAKRRWRAKQG